MPAMGFYDNSREYMHVGSLYLGQGCDEPLRYESTWGGSCILDFAQPGPLGQQSLAHSAICIAMGGTFRR